MSSEQEKGGPNGQPAEQSQTNGNTPPPRDAEKATQDESQNAPQKDEQPKEDKKEDKPAGGFDPTPLPRAPPGYTIKITFHRATNLPMADVNSLSSDPYVIAQMYTDIPTRHKEDPPLQKRTPTIRKSTDPEWNTDWIVANVPASGFRLKARIYDEDPATHDDRLGNAHINVPSLNENWSGMDNESFKVKKRSGSKRAYFVRIFATCIGTAKHLNGLLYVSIKMLGRTEDPNGGGRLYTVGPNWWIRHYSPMLGRFVGMKDDDDDQTPDKQSEKKRVQKYNFQANQMQLTGPVPWQLYHRYVEFRPFVKSMFTSHGIRGYLLSKALHHQHRRVYTYNRNSVSGILPSHSHEMTQQFLDLVHYDKGGRIFTYVITLDSLWRFTETGKEFGVDLLSKHTMHSDVSIYIAFSGEFFIRRLKHKHASSQDIQEDNEPTHPPDDLPNGPPETEAPKDPRYYELIIDNDSGTYRPNAKMLPLLKEFLSANFPGLKIMTLDCQADAEKMGKMKQEQRDRKKKEGQQVMYTQYDRSGSVSSSDEEALDELEAGKSRKDGVLRSVKRDASLRQKERMQRLKGLKKGRDQPDEIGEADEHDAGEAAGGSSVGAEQTGTGEEGAAHAAQPEHPAQS